MTPGTAILENTLGHLSQAEGIVKLPVGEQPGIRGDLGTVEFKLQSTVKNEAVDRFLQLALRRVERWRPVFENALSRASFSR